MSERFRFWNHHNEVLQINRLNWLISGAARMSGNRTSMLEDVVRSSTFFDRKMCCRIIEHHLSKSVGSRIFATLIRWMVIRCCFCPWNPDVVGSFKPVFDRFKFTRRFLFVVPPSFCRVKPFSESVSGWSGWSDRTPRRTQSWLKTLVTSGRKPASGRTLKWSVKTWEEDKIKLFVLTKI